MLELITKDGGCGEEGVLGGVGAVVHEEKVELAGVVDEESLVAGGHHVAGLLVGTVTDLGHGGLALEATAHGIVDTLGLSPAGVDALEAVRLVAVEAPSACRCTIPVSDVFFSLFLFLRSFGALCSWLLRSDCVEYDGVAAVHSETCGDGDGGGRTLLHDRNVLL